MLLGEGERPRASGMHPAAAQATNGLVLDLRHAVAQLWASSADAVNVRIRCLSVASVAPVTTLYFM